jgi:large subunit ribosomal protein L23
MSTITRERLYNIILSPRITEKASVVADSARQVVFEVASDAKKSEVKDAVEALFNVEVEKVRILNVKGKVRMFRQVRGKRNDWKKAYVCLKEGHDIDFVGKE